MSEAGAVGAVESKAVAYVVKGAHGGGYVNFEKPMHKGQFAYSTWRSLNPTRFPTVEEAVTAIIDSVADGWIAGDGLTIERVVETTHTTTKTEYLPL